MKCGGRIPAGLKIFAAIAGGHSVIQKRIVRVVTSLAMFCAAARVQGGDSMGVLGHLDLSRPELRAVKEAREAGDSQAALTALLQHFREREHPAWYQPSPAPPEAETDTTDDPAEAILRREYVCVGKAATLTHDIDWNINPVGDAEWPIELNRHGTWGRLVQAYNRTGNPAYAEDFVYQLHDWCTDNPRPADRKNARYTWRTLECGIRLMGSWPNCFFGLLRSPHFTPETMGLMLDAIWEQADYLMRFRGGGNWLITETAGLATAAVMFPEFADSATWLNEAFGRLAREIDLQVPPDGAQKELTPHYHAVTMHSFRAALRIAAFNDIPVPDAIVQGVERMQRYLAYVSKPDGHFPMFNDSDYGSVQHDIRDLARNDETIQYILTDGEEGTAPDFTSIAFPWAGQYVMRSGWDRDALYLALDAGPYGYGHQHEDKLHIDVYAYGRSHILDPGRYTYARGPWRDYFVGTVSHSTVLVDGRGQRRRYSPRESWVNASPQNNRWITSDFFDMVCGIYEDGYGGTADDVLHVRRIFFKRGEYWLVQDFLFGKSGEKEEHTASVQFQYSAPGAGIVGEGQGVTSHNDDANLLLLPVTDGPVDITLHEGEDSPPRGWIAWSYHKNQKDPATLAVIDRHAALPMRIDTLLFPYPGNEVPNVSMRRLPGNDEGTTDLEIRTPEWTDRFRWQDALRTGEVLSGTGTEAEISWERRDRDGRIAATAYHGTRPRDMVELAVSAEGRVLNVICPETGMLYIDYGFSAGGGCIYAVQEQVQEGTAHILLTDACWGQCYFYRAWFTGKNGSEAMAEGKLDAEWPTICTFEGGEGRDWQGATVVAIEDGGHILRGEGPEDKGVQYKSIYLPVEVSAPADFGVKFRFRTPMTNGGEGFYVKAYLYDEEGRYWSAYLDRNPVREWRTVTLDRELFRRDGGGKNDHPATTLPPGHRIVRCGFTVRKGRTTTAAAPIIEVDDVSWGW